MEEKKKTLALQDTLGGGGMKRKTVDKTQVEQKDKNKNTTKKPNEKDEEEEEEEEEEVKDRKKDEDYDDEDEEEMLVELPEKDVGEIQVDFEFFNIVKDDKWSIQLFLKNYLENQLWELRKFSNFLAKQEEIGTAIKVDENFFGFITVINIHKYKTEPYIKQIIEYITKLAPNDQVSKKLEALFSDTDKGLGLIINERVVNVPPQIAPPLHTGFFEELEEAKAENTSFDFKNYIFLSTVHNVGVGEITSKPQKKKTKTGEETVYTKPEEEIYCKEASFYFTSPPKYNNRGSRWTFEGMVNESRLVCVFNHSKVPTILEQIKKLCG